MNTEKHIIHICFLLENKDINLMLESWNQEMVSAAVSQRLELLLQTTSEEYSNTGRQASRTMKSYTAESGYDW